MPSRRWGGGRLEVKVVRVQQKLSYTAIVSLQSECTMYAILYHCQSHLTRSPASQLSSVLISSSHLPLMVVNDTIPFPNPAQPLPSWCSRQRTLALISSVLPIFLIAYWVLFMGLYRHYLKFSVVQPQQGYTTYFLSWSILNLGKTTASVLLALQDPLATLCIYWLSVTSDFGPQQVWIDIRMDMPLLM